MLLEVIEKIYTVPTSLLISKIHRGTQKQTWQYIYVEAVLFYLTVIWFLHWHLEEWPEGNDTDTPLSPCCSTQTQPVPFPSWAPQLKARAGRSTLAVLGPWWVGAVWEVGWGLKANHALAEFTPVLVALLSRRAAEVLLLLTEVQSGDDRCSAAEHNCWNITVGFVMPFPLCVLKANAGCGAGWVAVGISEKWSLYGFWGWLWSEQSLS